MLPKLALVYDWGARTFAKMATKHSSTTVTPPTTASLFRMSRRQASRQRLDVAADGAAAMISPTSRLVPDAGVDKAIDQVHREVHEGQEHPVEQDHSHDHRVIAPRHGKHEEAPQARDAEDGLDEEGAGTDGGEERSEKRYYRNAGVLENVLEDDRGLSQPLCASGPDVVGADDLHHARAREARDDAHGPERQRHRGQHPELRVVSPAARREEWEHEGEEHDQEHRQDEIGHADAERRNRDRHVIPRAVLVHGGLDAARHP